MLQGAISIIAFTIGFILLEWITRPTRWHRFSLHDLNDQNKARKWLIRDLNRAGKEVFIVTRIGRNEFWGNKKVLNAFRKAAKRNVEITFIVGPDFENALCETVYDQSNSEIRKLAEENVIELKLINERPPAGLRLVDGNGTYTSRYLDDQPQHNKRPFLWTWNHEKIAKKQLEVINHYLALASS